MFLTKKSIMKILLLAGIYFVLGSGCITVAIVFVSLGIEADLLFWLGGIAYALEAPLILFGRYAEGKGEWINRGNRLVRNELNPAEFIKEYELLKNSEELVVNKPSIEVLQLVAIAYDSLNDRENALATADEMIAVAGEKKKAYANLVKVSLLFSYKKTEEAEKLFEETQKLKLDFVCTALVDAILKSDRAMAMGDYKLAEARNLKMLEQTFPKLDNLGKLLVHYGLGEVYENLQDNEKAVLHYQYCIEHGGKTAIKESAQSAIDNLR
ncbi:MAG: hypothetical protein IJX74_00035 [Clostridia bacterium]|nr:hypothetical protein [Clostridia bacterium]